MLNLPSAGKEEVPGRRRRGRGCSCVASNGSSFLAELIANQAELEETVAAAASAKAVTTTAASATAAAVVSLEASTDSPSLRRRDIFDPHSKFKGMKP